MTSRDRLIAAWSFQEPDRVPIELRLDPALHNLPQAGRIAEFVDNEADNFIAVPSAYWDFFGLPVTERSETLDPSPEGHRRVKHVFSTPVGDFHRITRHSPHVSDPSDFYWERRYVHTLDDLVRLAEAPRAPLRLAEDLYTDAVHRIGHRGLPVIELSHPLGLLVRWANTEAVYGWLVTDAPVIHKLLEAANRQVVEAVQAIGRTAMQPWFIVCAHEMLLPPWMGPRMFDEFVFPYDKAVNDAVHRIGGKVRAHCHGCCARFLGRMADMGLDGIEPLEPAPYGDVDLREAKRDVGGRMLLSGNVPSQDFTRMTPSDVDQAVREAIQAAASGGGFTLRTTGGTVSAGDFANPEQEDRVLRNIEAYIAAALRYGGRA